MNRENLEHWLRPIVGGVVLLVTLLLVIGAAIRDPRPHDIAVGISGPPAAVDPIVGAFGQNAPGAFEFTTYGSEADARAALDDRSIVGALVVGPAGPTLIVAGGAGDAITGGVSQAFTAAFAAQGVDLAIETVHPLPGGDAHGIVLFFLVLATAISAVAAGAASVIGRSRGGWFEPSLVVTAFALASGVVGVATAAWLVGGYGDGTWQVMVIAALLALAIGLVVAAAGRWLGVAGVPLAAAVVVLLGLVSSGGPLGSTFLPDVYRAIAPWLPVGPAFSAIRGAVAFNGAGIIEPALVLAGWAVVGLAGLFAAELTSRAPVQRPRVAVA